MKTKSLYFAALLVVGAAVTAVGKNEPSNAGMAVVSVKGSQVFKVIYKGENEGKVKINIYDAASHIVYSETRNSVAGFILPLNFSGLEFGEYTIELTDASGTKAEKINYQPVVSQNNIHVLKVNEKGKFLLSVANTGSDDITIKIYDGYNNLVHSSSKQVSGDFAQLFSIKNFSGACTFEVTSSAGERTIVNF
jgi:hypothetical protein